MKLEWIDYEVYSNGFIVGITPKISVCRLHKTNYTLYDDITRMTNRIKTADSLEDAKHRAEGILESHWTIVKNKLNKIEL